VTPGVEMQQILPILMLLVLVGSFALLAGQPPNSERDLHCLSARRPPPELQTPLCSRVCNPKTASVTSSSGAAVSERGYLGAV
jgi:hypothetical protein